MSDIGLTMSGPEGPREPSEEPRTRGRRSSRARKGPGAGCLIPLVLLLALVGGGWWVAGKIADGNPIDKLTDRFTGPEDYDGEGSGEVTVEVSEGDSAGDIGRTLKSAGVVASVEAFTSAAARDPQSQGIQPGSYAVRKKMSADAALEALINPGKGVTGRVTIPEGSRVDAIVDRIVKASSLKHKDVEAALEKPEAIGLPASAQGNPEGYLYPATYTIGKKDTAVQVLREMVKKTTAVEKELGLERRAKQLGYTSEEVLTMASILEYEGKADEDLPKIARVFYNRVEQGMPLQSDATVSYATGVSDSVWTTDEMRNSESKYNTYKFPGLPPGPIGSPGERAIEAALKPAKGDWLYFVPTNLETGETAFAKTYAEHQKNVKKLRDWCAETGSSNCD